LNYNEDDSNITDENVLDSKQIWCWLSSHWLLSYLRALLV